MKKKFYIFKLPLFNRSNPDLSNTQWYCIFLHSITIFLNPVKPEP